MHRLFMFGFPLDNKPYTIDRWGIGVVGEVTKATLTEGAAPIQRVNRAQYEQEGWVDHFTFGQTFRASSRSQKRA